MFRFTRKYNRMLAKAVVDDGEEEVHEQLQWQKWGLDLDVWGLRDDCHLVNAVGARWWVAEVKLS